MVGWYKLNFRPFQRWETEPRSADFIVLKASEDCNDCPDNLRGMIADNLFVLFIESQSTKNESFEGLDG